jgi:hypothetical protein
MGHKVSKNISPPELLDPLLRIEVCEKCFFKLVAHARSARLD